MTPIHEWVGELRHRGLQLWLDGENLGYRAPKGTLGQPDLAELRARKPELIAFLRTVADIVPPIEASPRSGNPPQSFAQQRLWFLDQLNGPGAAYNIVSQHQLHGPLDCAALERSFRELCRRHEILRTTCATENGNPVQIVSPEARLPFSVIPVSSPEEALRLAEAEASHIFDLTTGPLLRINLLRFDETNHVLLLTAHHIILDGWSLGILFSELSSLYRGISLPAPQLHYADYAAWQRKWLTPAVLETQLAWWRRLDGAPPLLDLFPTVPSGTLSSRGAVASVRIPPDQARRFKLICQSSGATVFMGMLAAWEALLTRYTGQRDLVIGTQVAGRTRNEMEQVPGFFVNTLPLRSNIDLQQTFLDLLTQVKHETLEAIAHQDTPFEKIVEALQPDRAPGRNPLVQVMFLWQNARMEALSLDNVRIEPFPGVCRATAKFDLTLEMGESGDSFEGVLEYRTDLYDAASIKALAAHLETFIASIVQYPDRPLTSLSLLPAAEQQRLYALGAAEQTERPASTIAASFEHQVRRFPHREALVFGDQRLTYAELDARAGQLAAHLDIAPETPIGLFLDPSVELIVAMLAVLKAGGAYLPLDTRTPHARLATMLADSATPLVLTTQALAPRLPDTRTLLLDQDLPPTGPTPQAKVHPQNLAYIIYTSGSTGIPKGVMVSQDAVLNLAAWLGQTAFGEAPVRTALIASPVFDASVQQIFGCLLNGHTLYLTDLKTKRDGARLRSFFATHAIQLADCTPSLLAILCDAGLPGNKLQCLLVGGEALPAALVDEFRRQDPDRPIALINVYGPTECCVDSTSLAVETTNHSIVSIGRGIPNSEIYILDAYGHPVPESVPGEICIAGAGLGRGYWRQPVLTAQAFVPHPIRAGERLYRTGDHGYWNAAGNIEFLGRQDDQVKIRGHRIQLGDIETHLAHHPEVRQAVVIARQASAAHQELVAYLATSSALSIEELRRFLAGKLPDYMIPAHFVFLDTLPLNASGKVDRKRLPAPDTSHPVSSNFVAPRTPNEIALVTVWAAVLHRDHIGIHDHYIALGGDSIKALQISARLRDAGLKLQLSDLFLHPTIGALAPHLQPLHGQPHHEPAHGEIPLTPVQLRFLHEFGGRKSHFNQSTLLSASEPLDEASLRKALDRLVAHHDILRATFTCRNGEWIQTVPASGVAAFEVRNGEITQHAATIQASFNLETGPLFRAVLYRTDDGDRLFLCAHHLVIDAVSWRVLLEDLETAYRGRPLPARTTPFRIWARHLTELAQSVEVLPLPAPAREILPPLAAKDAATHSFAITLNADALRKAHDTYGTTANDLLLTALARAVRHDSGKPTARIWLEGHGRETDNLDLSRTLGWFTAIYPIDLDLGPTNDIDRHIKLVKETLRAVPHKGLGYGLARYLASPEIRSRFAAEPPPGIVFNNLGQFGGTTKASLFTPASEDCGPMSDPDARFAAELEINALAQGDNLLFHLSYHPACYSEATIAALSRHYQNELEAILAHTGAHTTRELTPSDVDYAGFNLDDMDTFLNNLPGEQ